MATRSAEELCEYLNVKSARIVDREEQADQSAAGLNGKLFKVSCVAPSWSEQLRANYHQ